MKIERVQIDGFGELSDFPVGPLGGLLTVIHGPNEAGKSTLLEFIRTVLFGFPPRNRAQFYAPTKGGRHGGSLHVIDDRNVGYLVERTETARGEVLAIRSDDGEQQGDSALARLLGQASREMFKSVFAFGIQELQDIGSLSDSEVSGRIYSAGMGAARLPDALRAIGSEREKLFKPGGSNQFIAKLLRELQTVEANLAVVRGSAAEYASLVARREDIVRELEKADSVIVELSARRNLIDRLLRAWPEWVAACELEQRLNDIPKIDDFPENASERLDSAETSLREAEEALDSLRAEATDAETKADAPIADETMLVDANLVEKIRRGRAKFDSAMDDLPGVQAELAQAEQKVETSLRELGTGWDVERLEEFDTSVEVRAELEEWREKLPRLDQKKSTADREMNRTERELRDATELVKEAAEAFGETPRPELGAAAIGSRRKALRETRTRFADYRLAVQRQEDLQYQLDQSLSRQRAAPAGSGTLRWALVGASAIACVATGLVLGGSALLFGIAVGLALIIAAAYLYLENRRQMSPTDRSSPLGDRLEQATETAGRNREGLLQSAAILTSAFPDSAALDSIEAELDQAVTILATWDAARARLAAAQEAETRSRKKADEAETIAEEARTELQGAQDSWRQWLAERDLTQTLKPAVAIDILTRAETAKLLAGQARDLSRRVQDIENGITQYNELVAPLATKHGLPIGAGESSSVALTAERLIERFDAARSAMSVRAQARELAERIQGQLKSQEKRAADMRDKISDLLKSGGAQDPETFRRTAAAQEERQKIGAELRQHEGGLLRLSGPGRQLEDFKARLSSANLQYLEEERERVDSSLSELEDRRTEFLSERGGVDVQIEHLAGDETASELRTHRAVLLERLKGAAAEWSILAIAEEILVSARAKYEEERQPRVLKQAEEFFRTVTGGRYEKLNSPLGSQTIEAVQADGTRKSPALLSRGTREQLYLALRLGLIRQFAEQATPLPVIVDEVFVNFDPERGRRVAEAFIRLAESNQVLVFTCHPSVVELFTAAHPGTQVIDLHE